MRLTRAKNEWTGITLCLETENVEDAIVKDVKAGAVAVWEIEDGEGACRGGHVRKVKDCRRIYSFEILQSLRGKQIASIACILPVFFFFFFFIF